MDGKGMCGSYSIVTQEKNDSFYSMYFGVSCAFFALKVLSGPEAKEERWSELCDKMLQGSTQLLGLLVWRIQKQGAANTGKDELLRKLDIAEKEIEELKKIRREDAKANEKVVGIYASQEQRWLMERKKLRQQIGALMNELRLLDKKKEEAISEMDDKLKDMEQLLESKDKAFQEEERKRKESEEKFMKAEKIAAELAETAKREAQEHSNDIWKHKTAFLELVSNQRQLEAEMGRAFKQLEAKRKELDSVLEQKEESVLLAQKLSVEVVKMRKDLDQKDKILSAMLRKSKLDTAEKQMLLREVKLSKAKRKQAELETERWRTVTESRHERHSLRSMFANQSNWPDDPSLASGTSQTGKSRSQSADCVLEYDNPEFGKDLDIYSPLSRRYSLEENDELAITADVKQLEGWVRLEAEKYATSIEKRHHLEIDAFAEQMRLKDEKLEAFRWRMLSMDIESKRLHSHIDRLNQDLTELRHENMKLEALLLERQEELRAMKEEFSEQIHPHIFQTTNRNSTLHDPTMSDESFWSKEEMLKEKPIEKYPITETTLMETSQEKNDEEEGQALDNQVKNASLIVQSPEKEFEEERGIPDSGSSREECIRPVEVTVIENLASPSQPMMKGNNSLWRIDLHALGVSYKIKRLKQQLLLLERLTGKQETGEDMENNENAQNVNKSFISLLSLLNKQVSRYQSLQGKADELCKRMHDSEVGTSQGDSSATRAKGETKALAHFLEETFQLQRYMVATGQKLGEVQSKIASGFDEVPEELDKANSSFDMKRFTDNMRTLFQEVQRGLEVRIARIIGDLEGTLACEGMIRMRR
ncbi:hypothetical protein Tsubulata_009786 [Turnera subulata]|uniref:Uncharacterized protein n=1 Tax=Turnera subulata TaxID=218843 RepID=A0A9Q0GJ16_9ROSI|nr:hypothetical protein Tsubulata_009786 [Turnera subulata]